MLIHEDRFRKRTSWCTARDGNCFVVWIGKEFSREAHWVDLCNFDHKYAHLPRYWRHYCLYRLSHLIIVFYLLHTMKKPNCLERMTPYRHLLSAVLDLT